MNKISQSLIPNALHNSNELNPKVKCEPEDHIYLMHAIKSNERQYRIDLFPPKIRHHVATGRQAIYNLVNTINVPKSSETSLGTPVRHITNMRKVHIYLNLSESKFLERNLANINRNQERVRLGEECGDRRGGDSTTQTVGGLKCGGQGLVKCSCCGH